MLFPCRPTAGNKKQNKTKKNMAAAKSECGSLAPVPHSVTSARAGFFFFFSSTSCLYLVTRSYRSLQSARGRLTWGKQSCPKTVGKVSVSWLLLGGSGGVVNSLDLCPASLKSLGCFYFRCLLSSQWKAVTVTANFTLPDIFGGP